MARLALRQGGAATTLLNAANEAAVAAFLAGRIGFLGVARTVGRVLDRVADVPCDDLDSILAYDAEARRVTVELLPLAG
jgi:1-deoxy-D-xylulose-5-phosphate reductoisomerase